MLTHCIVQIYPWRQRKLYMYWKVKGKFRDTHTYSLHWLQKYPWWLGIRWEGAIWNAVWLILTPWIVQKKDPHGVRIYMYMYVWWETQHNWYLPTALSTVHCKNTFRWKWETQHDCYILSFFFTCIHGDKEWIQVMPVTVQLWWYIQSWYFHTCYHCDKE